jgi:hypothetical protein
MTDERDFDRISRAWLDLMPSEAPDRAVAAVLQAVETTPQVRRAWRRPFERNPNMNRLLMVAAVAAAAILAVGGGLWLTRSDGPPIGVSSPTPVPSASSSASTPVPSQLQATWMGDHNDLVAAEAGSAIVMEGTGLHLTQSAGSDATYLWSAASATSAQQLRLETQITGDGCEKGAVGDYSWSVSPSGRILTITAERDACSNRAAAVAGTWWRMACPTADDNCLGTLDAGTYKSQFITPHLDPDSWRPIFGAVTYTVPDGWANAADWPGTFDLTPAAEVPAGETDVSRMVSLSTHPTAMRQDKPCSDTVQPGVGRSVADLTSWIRTLPGLVSAAPTAITIDGHPGQAIDIRLDPSWKKKCAGDTEPKLTFLNPGIFIGPGQRERMILLDLGGGDVIAIGLWTRDQAVFDAFIAEALPIVESFRFK